MPGNPPGSQRLSVDLPDVLLPDEAWQLSPSVALRPEPFGALAYHFGNRRLIFLKRPKLVAVVRGLERHHDQLSVLRLLPRRLHGR